jgi:hypothetical protein
VDVDARAILEGAPVLLRAAARQHEHADEEGEQADPPHVQPRRMTTVFISVISSHA